MRPGVFDSSYSALFVYSRVIIDANFTKIATLVNITVTLSGIPQGVLPDWCVNQVTVLRSCEVIFYD